MKLFMEENSFDRPYGDWLTVICHGALSNFGLQSSFARLYFQPSNINFSRLKYVTSLFNYERCGEAFDFL